MKEITLPSGAKLKISLVPFQEARDLYQAFLEEIKELKIDLGAQADFNFFKELGCTAFSSKRIQKALDVCLKRCLYNELKIDENTFESEVSRGDYLQVLFEVAQEVTSPFLKNLTLLLKTITEKMQNFQA